MGAGRGAGWPTIGRASEGVDEQGAATDMDGPKEDGKGVPLVYPAGGVRMSPAGTATLSERAAGFAPAVPGERSNRGRDMPSR